MTILRRLLGIFVMIAGIIGLLMSLAGLVGLWMVKPAVSTSLNTTIDLLISSVNTSHDALGAADLAIGAGITSEDALSEMLSNTSLTVVDTQPVITQLSSVMGEQLPTTLEKAGESIKTA